MAPRKDRPFSFNFSPQKDEKNTQKKFFALTRGKKTALFQKIIGFAGNPRTPATPGNPSLVLLKSIPHAQKSWHSKSLSLSGAEPGTDGLYALRDLAKALVVGWRPGARVALRRVFQRDDVVEPVARDVQDLALAQNGLDTVRLVEPRAHVVRGVRPVRARMPERRVVPILDDLEPRARERRREDVPGRWCRSGVKHNNNNNNNVATEPPTARNRRESAEARGYMRAASRRGASRPCCARRRSGPRR